MSTNFFAALDDSGDEGPSKKVPAKKEVAKKPAPKKTVAEPSKVDTRKHPGHNDRNTKFGRGGKGPVRDGKRQFDRRSGTGRGKEIKKGGGGARNWGSDKNEARRAEGHVDDPAAGEGAPAPTEEGEEPAVEEEQEPEPEPEPEDNTMSYEEYLASKANPDNAAFTPKEEREVTNEFAGLSVKPKPKEEEEEFFSKGGVKQKKKKNKAGSNKGTVVTPEFRIVRDSGASDDRRRDGGGRGRGRGDGRGRGRDGGRGGRDGGRGGRGRGDGRGRGKDGGRGGRGGRGRGEINVLDQSAFPSL